MLENPNKLFICILCLAGFSTTACAETPSAVVPTANYGSATEAPHEEEESFKLTALKYSGSDFFGQQCDLYVSLVEEEHEAEESEEHHDARFIAKLDYQVHGNSPADIFVDFYSYSLKEQVFYSIDEPTETTFPVLYSVTLKNGAEGNPNESGHYEAEGELSQSFRLDFDKNLDVNAFVEALEESVEGGAVDAVVLDQVKRVVLKVAHVGHYDPAACSDFSFAGVEEAVSFEAGHHDDHEGDDHDHDHDHE